MASKIYLGLLVKQVLDYCFKFSTVGGELHVQILDFISSLQR